VCTTLSLISSPSSFFLHLLRRRRGTGGPMLQQIEWTFVKTCAPQIRFQTVVLDGERNNICQLFIRTLPTLTVAWPCPWHFEKYRMICLVQKVYCCCWVHCSGGRALGTRAYRIRWPQGLAMVSQAVVVTATTVSLPGPLHICMAT